MSGRGAPASFLTYLPHQLEEEEEDRRSPLSPRPRTRALTAVEERAVSRRLYRLNTDQAALNDVDKKQVHATPPAEANLPRRSSTTISPIDRRFRDTTRNRLLVPEKNNWSGTWIEHQCTLLEVKLLTRKYLFWRAYLRLHLQCLLRDRQ